MEVKINGIDLWRLTKEANKRPFESAYIKKLLDDTLQKQLGIITEFGALTTTKPNETELYLFEEAEIDDYRTGNGKVKGWRRKPIINPSSERDVFPAFKNALKYIEDYNRGSFKCQPKAQVKEIFDEWITEKEAGCKKSTRPTPSILSIVQHTQKQVIIGKMRETLNGQIGKGVAPVIDALLNLGYIKKPSGGYRAIYTAIRDEFGYNIGTDQSINNYRGSKTKEYLSEVRRYEEYFQ